MRRVFVPLTAFVLAVAPLGLQPLSAWAVPTCFGKPATHVMQPGEGGYEGTTGDDVVVGSDGPDLIDLDNPGGTDLACGAGGDDDIFVSGSNSKADSGPGRDDVEAYGGGLARGGSGDDDFLYADGVGARIEGGSGDDYLRVGSGASGNGGSGDDFLEGSEAIALDGGSGGDTVRNYGAARIDCGSAYDQVFSSGATSVKRCEETLTKPPVPPR